MSSAGETVYLNLATRRFTLYVRGRHKLDGTAVSIFVNSTNITTNIETGSSGEYGNGRHLGTTKIHETIDCRKIDVFSDRTNTGLHKLFDVLIS